MYSQSYIENNGRGEKLSLPKLMSSRNEIIEQLVEEKNFNAIPVYGLQS